MSNTRKAQVDQIRDANEHLPSTKQWTEWKVGPWGDRVTTEGLSNRVPRPMQNKSCDSETEKIKYMSSGIVSSKIRATLF